ncbi:hydrogenase maturation protease [Herbaspirillum sp. RTI4]|uniref:hydrogenase maturation protease n=1 Tax=Herbaspirillum sp. RTI4 TaxID=3048640 RepID=UPI002AB361DE|nr:hydrogenase maturation protease [Herbaspirillum sp. RTI4]MDY7577064.1 hydrogenase maturation protease [Herbaspirillum sp. RTI4]MEA9982244.1 hydrogenase maturation protease [Herbaspirillum sp. RTI4]
MNAGSKLTLDYFDNEASLIYGIGNIGRQDDGLGWEFIDWLETASVCTKAERVKFYQLNLEDADLISHQQRVLFVDASKEVSDERFRFYKAEQKMDFSFTSHDMSIETIMATCWQCFAKMPEVYVLAIKGYEWELQIGLTDEAKKNLRLASSYMQRGTSVAAPTTDDRLQYVIGGA